MFLWGRLKQIVYATAVPNDIEVLKGRIIQAVQSISQEEIRNSFTYLRKQLEKCVKYGGGVFEL